MELKASFVFDGEHAITLHAMNGNWSSSHS